VTVLASIIIGYYKVLELYRERNPIVNDYKKNELDEEHLLESIAVTDEDDSRLVSIA